MKHQRTIVLATLALPFLLGACAKVSFSSILPGTNSVNSSENLPLPPPTDIVCGPDQIKINRPTRVLFVVDQSGSNLNGPYEAPGEATDPTKQFRYNVMDQFYLANQEKDNLTWGLDVFNASSAINLMTDSSGQSPSFSGLAPDFYKALTQFYYRKDEGQTPYKAALSLVKQNIATDLLTAPKYVSYLVVFMTDGYPTDYCPGSPTEYTCPGKILEDQIDTDVRAISSLAPDAVQFSTVYYGKPDSDAAKRLSRMASLGQGQFIDTNTTLEVKLNDLLELNTEVCVKK